LGVAGTIDDIDDGVKRERSRLFAANANDLIPSHDHVVDDLATRQDERDPMGSHARLPKQLDLLPQPFGKDVSRCGIEYFGKPRG